MTGDAGSYRGRFAPSPTGPLHLGSLLAAVASYLDARANGGAWLLRLEDIDPPREMPGATTRILACLRGHGLHWDEAVLYQNERAQAYTDTLAALEKRGLLMRCYCTRRILGPDGDCGGRCGGGGSGAAALRVRVDPDWQANFDDLIQGPQRDITLPGDFVVKRRDGLYAYQLAVVVDDAFQGISHVIRGADLLPVTPRQRYLQHVLGYASPDYGHCPVLLGPDGRKLSKQNHAPALDNNEAATNLRRVLSLLDQTPPPVTLRTPQAILDFASNHWSLAGIGHTTALRP